MMQIRIFEVLYLLLHKLYLRRKNYIKKSFAVLVLGIFILSNTPTRYLHLMFADHSDFITKNLVDSHSPQLSVTGINCHCESNVVIAPYTFKNGFEIQLIAPVYIQNPSQGFHKITFSKLFYCGLRAPPSFS